MKRKFHARFLGGRGRVNRLRLPGDYINVVMRFTWKEPLSWTPLLERTSGHRQSARMILHAAREAYDAIEVYHAARAIDVDAYYHQGIRLADHVSLTAAAH